MTAKNTRSKKAETDGAEAHKKAPARKKAAPAAHETEAASKKAAPKKTAAKKAAPKAAATAHKAAEKPSAETHAAQKTAGVYRPSAGVYKPRASSQALSGVKLVVRGQADKQLGPKPTVPPAPVPPPAAPQPPAPAPAQASVSAPAAPAAPVQPKPVSPAPAPAAQPKPAAPAAPAVQKPAVAAPAPVQPKAAAPAAPVQPKPVSPAPAPAAQPKPVPAPAPKPAPVQQPKPAPAQQPKPAPAAQPKPAPAPAPAPAAAPAAKPAAAAKVLKPIKVTGQPTVRELAEKMEMKVNDFIKKLMGMGVFASINQRLEPELASMVSEECGFKLEVVPMYAEKELESSLEGAKEDPALLKQRPPVVTIMGHVDHGKTSLLDAIRKSHVADGEAGAITQHIGAYRVETPKGVVVFLDTPGHEAFTAMRARGAQATDIVVLVVSATDGVMPQTIEAIDHAKAAGAPIIVAVNKIDLPGANPERIKQELSQHGVAPEEWGGKNIMVEISAKKRVNIDKLLEMIAVQSEMMELKSNPDKRGVASIIEAERDPKRGVVAHVLMQSGTIKVGDPFVVGTSHGRVRALINEYGARLEKIGPSEPAEILGINGEPPQVGDMFYVTENEKEARQIAEKRKLALREDTLAHQKHVTLLGLRSQLDQRKLKILQVILKGDVQGSIQAIRDSLERLSTEEVEIKIIHAGPGNVNESDILLAKASDAIILGFNICAEPKAAEEAEREGIEIRNYNIIFELIGDVRAAMEGLLEPEIVEIVAGRAEVRQVFTLSAGTIAGSFVTDGKVVRGKEGRVLRGKDTVYKGKITGLKRFKDDVKEVEKGFECGILMEGFRQFQPGDHIEVIEKQSKVRRLESKCNA
ncbi:MAG: translation initiation factor IF-2 [Elusimicrobia bacterium]|nr:translation initiation factor IF-2 [Elusimicrobiota bacterium]